MDEEKNGKIRRRGGIGRNRNVEVETINIRLGQIFRGKALLNVFELELTANWR
jgi:hypothetical protein